MANFDFSKIYSYSKLNLFDKCKKQYHFNYLDPLIAPIKKQFLKPRDYKTKGSAVHSAITLFYYLPEKKQNFENLKKCLAQSWFSEINLQKAPPLGSAGGFKNLDHERKIYLDCLKMLKNFLAMEEETRKSEFSSFLIPTKEIRDSFSDYENAIRQIGEDIFISGKFDRIDELPSGNLRVVDFKTSRDSQNYFQLEFYKLLAEMNFNKKVETVTFYFLGTKRIENFNVLGIEDNKIKNQVLEKINKIKNTNAFPAEPTRICNHCDFQEICEPGQQGWKNLNDGKVYKRYNLG